MGCTSMLPTGYHCKSYLSLQWEASGLYRRDCRLISLLDVVFMMPAGAAGVASKLGKLEGYSPASYSCTALYMQQRGLCPFPISLTIFLFQNQLHLQFQHYLEQKGFCVLSLHIKRQPSSPSSSPSDLLWKDGLLKDATASQSLSTDPRGL